MRTQDPTANSTASIREDDDFAFNQAWAPHPITGGGLKWFRSGNTLSSGPHNIVVAELSESGVLGLSGLVVLLGITFAALWKRRDGLAW